MKYLDKSLEESYNIVGSKVVSDLDFDIKNLQSSRDLFESDSLAAHSPIPKSLEVFALLSGLPFSAPGLEYLLGIQRDINEIIPDTLKYWVEPDNMGVEYLVLKWPDQTIEDEQVAMVQNYISELSLDKFNILFSGVQIHRDGCVVIRGFDEGKSLRRLRQKIKQKFSFIPDKQSSWCHIPIGRILEPVGSGQFSQLKDYVFRQSATKTHTEEIVLMALIHETRWYMKEREVLQSYFLGAE